MASLTPEQHERIWHLHLRKRPQTEIAQDIGCHRNTVSASIRKTLEALASEQTMVLAQERARSIGTYDLLQQHAWQALDKLNENSTAAIGWANVLVTARRQADKVLGLEAAAKPDDPVAALLMFKSVVSSVILTEAPQLGAVIAERLLAAAKDQ